MLYIRAARVETEEEKRLRNSQLEDLEFDDEPLNLPLESTPVDATPNTTESKPKEASGDSKDSPQKF